MGVLTVLDYVIIAAYLAVALVAGTVWARSAGRSMKDFFLSGRSLPWWLAGISMAATNFSIDTPLAITQYVAEQGVAGVWFFWSNAISALLAAFLFARLWSRADVVTDAELIEKRYSGPEAAGLRFFKGFYFGVFVNCYVLGWVIKAVMKIMGGVTDLPLGWVLAVCVGVALVYTLASGLKGVVWTDFIQYGVGMAGSILLAYFAVREVGGLDGLMAGLEGTFGSAQDVTRFLPGFGGPVQTDVLTAAASGFEMSLMPTSVFVVYLSVQWWAYKYSDGGGKHIQRMLACRSEMDARGASLLFSVVNYAIQVWPWILTALCSLILLGPLEDPEMGYPLLMAKLLPAGLLGLVVVSLLGAFMSTVDTHLNLGAAYMVNDLYKRFVRPRADERHYVVVSRLAMMAMLAAGIGVALAIDSVGNAWKFILAFTSGAGLTWVLRWFWWRVNAWSEIAAMFSSGLLAIALEVGAPHMAYTTRLLWVVGLSTVVWVTVTFLTRPVDESVLVAFVRQVRPGSPGWRRIYRRHGLEPEPYLANGLLNWAVGMVALFSLNFAVGSFLLDRAPTGWALLVLAGISSTLLFFRLREGKPKGRPRRLPE